MNSQPIESVIFDFGKVLVSWNPEAALIARYSPNLIKQFLTNSVSGFEDANSWVDHGGVWSDAIENMRREHGEIWAEMMTYYTDNFNCAIQGMVPGSLQLAKDLKEVGINLYGLSNWGKENINEVLHSPAFPVFDLLDDIVISSFVQYAKPERELYELAIARFGVNPATTIFIDDRVENIEMGEKCGIRGIVWCDPIQVRQDLIARGANIPNVRFLGSD